MPLRKGYSRSIVSSNIRELHTGSTYAHTEGKFGKHRADKQSVAIALDTARRSKRRAEGGGVFDWSGVGEATPESIGRERVMDPLVAVPKRALWDLPREAVEAAQSNPLPGLRREDYTDVPGRGQPVDPMVGASLETGLNAMGAPLIGGTVGKAGEAVLGSGAIRRPPAADLSHIDEILAAERGSTPHPEPVGVTSEPRPAELVPTEAAAAPEPAGVGPGGGGPPGARGLPEAQATAARWAGERQPLENIPGPLKIGEDHFVPGPIGKIHDVAADYMRTHHPDRPYTPPKRYHPIDPEHSKAIAQAYEDMKHTPNDPATKASYNALIDETAKQYQAIKDTGLKIEPIPPGMADPYAKNPRMAAVDVAENNHLWFFPTEGGFGTVNKITDNPMLRPTGEKIGQHEMLANDMFRVVHDYFGHLKEGHGFRAPGEDNAWRAHAAMYSDLARPAMTSETRGQNSNVNFSNKPLHSVIGEAEARRLYGDAGRKAGAESGSPQRGRVSHGEGVPGVQSVARDDGSVLQSKEPKLGELRGARDYGSPSDAKPAGLSGRHGAASDLETSGRPVSEQQRQLRAGEHSVGDRLPESGKSASQRQADIRRPNTDDVTMGARTGDFPPRDVGAIERARMDPSAGLDVGEAQPRWKTITVGEHNRKASAADTIYADQKVGLMPEWTMRDRGSPEPIIAYHGSPYSFDRFSSEHLGAGEGNQAYGHGLYFAGHSPVSEWYRHQLAIRRDPLIEKYGLDSEQGSWLGQHLHSFGGDADRAIADIDKQIRNLKYEQANGRTDLATKNMIRDREAKAAYLRDPQRNPGHMYQVAIDANPEHFLNWDARLGEQSPLVQDFARPILEEQKNRARLARQQIIAKGDPRQVARLQMQPKPWWGDEPIDLVRGPEIYKRAGLPAGNQSEGFIKASQRMKEAGIPGIKYLDQGSRGGGGGGTHNFITFDDNMLRILRKYGVAGIPAAGVLGADGEERRATGGSVNSAMEVARRLKRAKGGKIHVGPIIGDTDGRADEVPMEVPDGAYVLTSDHCSSMGEGNTLAGFKRLNDMFPASAKARTAKNGPIKRASGGKVPIYAADGEYVICPEDIIKRWGDLDHGHRILDEWQTAERKEHVKTLKNLAPPAQD